MLQRSWPSWSWLAVLGAVVRMFVTRHSERRVFEALLTGKASFMALLHFVVPLGLPPGGDDDLW